MAANGDRLSVLDGERIAIRHRASTQVVARAEVICARAAKNGTWIVTIRGQFKVREAMNRVVDKLATIGVVRIHRGVAVNGEKVRCLVGRSQHRLIVVLDDEVHFEVGRQFQRAVRTRFGATHRS